MENLRLWDIKPFSTLLIKRDWESKSLHTTQEAHQAYLWFLLNETTENI